MKRFALTAALLALSTVAMGQNQVAVDEIRISGASDRIELPDQLRNVWADEFDQVKGSYRLSNGKTMQLGMWGNRMYAKIEGMPRSQLVAVTPHMFVGLDRQMRISIKDVDAAGPIRADVLLLAPGIASNSEPSVTRLVAVR